MLTEWEEGNETFSLDDLDRLLGMTDWLLRIQSVTPSSHLETLELAERAIEVMIQRLSRNEIEVDQFMEQLSSEELQRLLLQAEKVFESQQLKWFQLKWFHMRFVDLIFQVIQLRIQAVTPIDLMAKLVDYPIESIHISEMNAMTSLLKEIAEKRSFGHSDEESVFQKLVLIGDSYPHREITSHEADEIVWTARNTAYFTDSLFDESSYPRNSTLSVSENHRLFIEKDLAERVRLAQQIKDRAETQNASTASRLFYLTLAHAILHQNADRELEEEVLQQLEQMKRGEESIVPSQYGELDADYLLQAPGIFRHVWQKHQLLQEIETILKNLKEFKKPTQEKPLDHKMKGFNQNQRNEFPLLIEVQL
jgi:hypothetical protein